jgi:CheY-like chemotaxis protein
VARIVIADDEETIRGLAARALSQDGHEVATAGDGAEAIEALGRQPFDLLLADIRMPVMDGIALALATARDHPGTTIVLMTGYADQRERASGLERLIHAVLTKPFAVEELRAAVAQALAVSK